MLAKRFFYVSAALFLLVLTYQIGAQRAFGQAGQEVAAVASGGGGLVTASGAIYECPVGDLHSWVYWGQFSGLTSPAVYYASGGPSGVPDDRVIVTRDGGIYSWSYATHATSYYGNVFGDAPTASQPSTWGQVKSTYRK